MKKVLAVIFAFAILCSCFSFAVCADAVKPTITIQRNQEASVAEGASTTLSLTATDFDSVKGMNLIIDAPAGVTFTGLSGSFTGASPVALSENDNYVLSDRQIKIVKAFVITPATGLEADITLEGSDVGEYELTVTAQLVNGEVAFFSAGTYNTAADSFVVNKTDVQSISDSSELANPEDNTFIPYGALYSGTSGSYVYPEKNEDGSFDLDSAVSYSYTAFKLPTNTGRISTFAASQTVDYVDEYPDGIQFGSYTQNASLGYHGTFIFKGDFSAFCSDKGITEQSALTTFANNLKDNPNKWYKLPYDGRSKNLYVARVPQASTMWRGSGALQYALRVYHVKPGEQFTAVGYTLIGENIGANYHFSDEYQTKTYVQN